MNKIVTVVGARPQFVKAAAVSRALAVHGGFEEIIVHTGQHYDPTMSDVFFEELEIPAPKYALDIHGGSHGDMTGRMMAALEPVIMAEKPAWMMVYGDTNSTLAGALVAAKLHIPVAHVEAGLRSFNRRMPEEINRVVADHLSELLLCPTRQAVINLESEGVKRGVHAVGDVMYDATIFAVEKAKTASKILDKLGLRPGSYDIATIHRAESTDDVARLSEIAAWLSDKAAIRPLVLPLHPRTRGALARTGVTLDGIKVIDPVGYLDMAQLVGGCVEVYTDSGGLQKEAYFHRKLCTTLRDETEWVETVESGWNQLWRNERANVRSEITDYGKGDAAARIADVLAASS
jgi:UDP-GlcNAc3NAcA epimerase